jgi:sulfatase modifying factor 1
MNPMNDNPDEPRKIVRGGSWKDVAYFLETGTRVLGNIEDQQTFVYRIPLCIVENLSWPRSYFSWHVKTHNKD